MPIESHKRTQKPIPLNTKNDTNHKTKTPLQFEIDSPPDKPETENKPSLKSLLQKLGVTERTPEYHACVKFLETISPKNKHKQTEIVDLTSPTERTNDMNEKEILFVKKRMQRKKLQRKKGRRNARRRRT